MYVTGQNKIQVKVFLPRLIVNFLDQGRFKKFNLNLIFACNIYVVVNFLSQVIFVFLLFLGMVMYANKIETKEK